MIKTKVRRSSRTKSKKTKGISLGKKRKSSLKRGKKPSGKKVGRTALKRRHLRKKRRIRHRVAQQVPKQELPALPLEGDPSPAYQHAYNEAYQHGFNSGFNQGLEDGHKLAYQARV